MHLWPYTVVNDSSESQSVLIFIVGGVIAVVVALLVVEILDALMVVAMVVEVKFVI